MSLGYLLRLVVGGEGVACTAAVEGEPSLLVTQVGDTSVRCVKSEYQFIGFIQLEEEQMKGFGAPLNSLWEVMKW